ncbi:MAG: hydrogenase small subunit [Chloroflexota bacterium]|jgi:hydrogenase small subunit|nr:hydrogenase small subunit [Chloroflexota bacterium]
MRPRDESLHESMVRRGMSRRAFLQFTAAMAAALALPMSYAPRIATAITTSPRIPVIWLRGQGCGGETRALLQAPNPTTAELLLELVSVEYHEALMARSGASAEEARRHAQEIAPGSYIAIVEGAVPTGDNGVYCTVGGRAFSEVVREVCGGALATIAVGSCAVDGGAPAAAGGTTGSDGVGAIVSDATLVNLPGCPVNVVNLTATIVHYLTFKAAPATDARHRPLFAYGNLLHNQCERRAHFEFGEFAMTWGDEGAQRGWCLYKLGCKGPENFSNCPTERYAEGASWPVAAGHGCIGCTSPASWDAMGPAYDRLPGPLPFAPQVTADQLGLALVGGVAAATVLHGGASAIRLRRWAAEERRASAPAAADSEAEEGGP